MVREWHEDEGWGVLDSEATPGGCWTHFSNLDMGGYRSLRTAQVVEFTVETPGQDGFDFRASAVRLEGDAARGPVSIATEWRLFELADSHLRRCARTELHAT